MQFGIGVYKTLLVYSRGYWVKVVHSN